MLDEKLAAIVATRAPTAVCACDSSCLMHIGGGLRAASQPGARRPSGGDARVVSTPASRARGAERFERAARATLTNARVRANVLHATTTIRAKRAAVVAEVPDWEELRRRGRGDQGRALPPAPRRGARRARVVGLGAPAARCTGRGDAAEANEIVTRSCGPRAHDEVVKVKSLTTDEIRLNEALLEAAGSDRSRPTSPS